MTATVQKTLRCATIGVGKMGRHHARLYAQTEGCELVGVVDERDVFGAGRLQREGVADRERAGTAHERAADVVGK